MINDYGSFFEPCLILVFQRSLSYSK